MHKLQLKSDTKDYLSFITLFGKWLFIQCTKGGWAFNPAFRTAWEICHTTKMKKEKIHVFFVANTIPVTGYVKLYTFHFSACQTYQIVAIHYAQQQHQTASRGMSLICNALMWKIIHKQYALLKVTNTRRAMNCFSLSCGALCLV